VTSLVWLVAAVVAFRLVRALLHRAAVRAGLCRYHSPLLYTTGLGRRREIHLGTTADFLLRGDVFTEDVIDAWISYKIDKEVKPMALRPHPYEFGLYYDV